MEVTVVGYLERCMCWGPFSTLLSRDVAPTLTEGGGSKGQVATPPTSAICKH